LIIINEGKDKGLYLRQYELAKVLNTSFNSLNLLVRKGKRAGHDFGVIKPTKKAWSHFNLYKIYDFIFEDKTKLLSYKETLVRDNYLIAIEFLKLKTNEDKEGFIGELINGTKREKIIFEKGIPKELILAKGHLKALYRMKRGKRAKTIRHLEAVIVDFYKSFVK